MKLSRKLPLCFAAVAIVVACAGFFGLSELNRSIGTYRGAVTSYSQAQGVETLLSTFKTQIQEWKNTLLRGKDDAQRAKYWKALPRRVKPRSRSRRRPWSRPCRQGPSAA